jgi:hypothetical protein
MRRTRDPPLHLRRGFDPEQVEERGHDVRGLGEGPATLAGLGRVVRVMEEQRDVRHLVEARHPALAPPVVLAKQEAVVGGEEEGRVRPQSMRVETIQEAPKLGVAQGHYGAVVGPQLGALVRRLRHALVWRPVEDGTGVVGRILRPVRRRRVERLVGIERLDLQEPVLRLPVSLEEIEPGIEAAYRWEVRLLPDELPIDDVVVVEAAWFLVELERVIHLPEPLPRPPSFQ